jgi:hypothetical protein
MRQVSQESDSVSHDSEITRSRGTQQQREAATLLGFVRPGLPDPVQPHLLGRGRLDARGIARFLARLGARAEEGRGIAATTATCCGSCRF